MEIVTDIRVASVVGLSQNRKGTRPHLDTGLQSCCEWDIALLAVLAREDRPPIVGWRTGHELLRLDELSVCEVATNFSLELGVKILASLKDVFESSEFISIPFGQSNTVSADKKPVHLKPCWCNRKTNLPLR